VKARAAVKPTLLCISQSFAPQTTPTAIRAGKLLQRLAEQWDVTVLTEAEGPHDVAGVRVETVHSRPPTRLLATLRRLRLDKLIELAVWPDHSIFWVLPAIRAARRLIREQRPSAIVVFMMPYSAGLVGLALRRLTRLPLVLNLDDSLTCGDMHPYFPTALHFRAARALEDAYARRADAVVYVSATNLAAVRERQPEQGREKLHLVRYGADRAEIEPSHGHEQRFEIAYVGAMSGWWALIEQSDPPSPVQRAFRMWSRLGRYRYAELDERTSSPAVIGRAIATTVGEHPDWAGRVRLSIHGNPYPEQVVARALAGAGVDDVVEVSGPIPHEQVAQLFADADLLFLTLPARPDGSPGGRISAKTYEYLATDRPILAAVPTGENWDYLSGKAGVWLVDPSDWQRMKDVIGGLARAKFAGRPMSFDRGGLSAELSYDTRAVEFDAVIRAAIERRGG
jgi:hypothetical protein